LLFAPLTMYVWQSVAREKLTVTLATPMPRLARIVIPGLPHHVTQRGVRRERVFFGPEDHIMYRRLLATSARQAETEVWAYCFMPNHAHLILVPRLVDGLRQTLANPQRRYAIAINRHQGWSGHLWEARYGSLVMDESHLANALRYVSLNPVRAGLVKHAEHWPWSSVRAHLAGVDDELVTVAPVLSRFPDFRQMIEEPVADSLFASLRRNESTGYPLGSKEFVARVMGER
jgi:putative transposase